MPNYLNESQIVDLVEGIEVTGSTLKGKMLTWIHHVVLPIKLLFVLSLVFSMARIVTAGEGPYFVTYNHHMEEPGSLELSLSPVWGFPGITSNFMGVSAEIEYGVKGWWTMEFYLQGQGTDGQGALFTGYRWENRVRPLLGEHKINPVLYVEFEDVNGADRAFKEVVGHDSKFDLLEPISAARLTAEREFETKLILSSNFRGWNVAENFIAVKNVKPEPWEFGYALGVSRPLALAASPDECRFCRENFLAGLELYGGLGEWGEFGLRDTSHYLAPSLAWQFQNGTTIRVSPSFGLTSPSIPLMVRFSVSREIGGFTHQVREWFR